LCIIQWQIIEEGQGRPVGRDLKAEIMASTFESKEEHGDYQDSL
jgi:hypothetical protein